MGRLFLILNLFCWFINGDPDGFNGGLNLYAYANGNPVSYVDPFGLGAVNDAVAAASWVHAPTPAETQIQDALASFADIATLGLANLVSETASGQDLWGTQVSPEEQKTSAILLAVTLLPGLELEGAGDSVAVRAAEGVDEAAESGVWSLEPGPRGLAIESQLGGNLPAGFRTIDRFENGVVTSIKSIDLNAATYQNARALSSRLNGYVDSLAGWTGQPAPYGGVVIQPGQVTTRTLQVAIPQGSMSAAQQTVFNAAAQRAQRAGLNFIVTPIP